MCRISNHNVMNIYCPIIAIFVISILNIFQTHAFEAVEGLTVGVCFPDTCSQENIENITRNSLQRINLTIAIDIMCLSPDSGMEWDAKNIVAL